MKLRYVIKLALLDLVDKHKLAVSIVLGSLVLSLISAVILIGYMSDLRRMTAQRALKSDLKQVYICNRTGGADINADERVADKIREIEGIKNVGGWGVEETDAAALLAPLTNEKKVKIVWMDKGTWELFDIRLSVGKSPDEVDSDSDVLVYVGNKLKNTQLGKEYYSGKDKFSVEGYMKKNTFIASGETLIMDEFLVNSLENLDNSIVLVMNKVLLYDTDVMFDLEEDADPEQIREKIYNNTGLDYSTYVIRNLNDVIELHEESYEGLKNKILEIALVIGFSVIMIFMCFETSLVLIKRKKIGIYYISGLQKKDIIKIIVSENMIKNMVSYMMSMLIVSGLIYNVYRFSSDYTVMMELFYEKITLYVFGVMMLITILTTIMPLITFKKMAIIDLIK